MEESTLIQLRIPEEFDYKLNVYLLDLKQTGVKKSKAQLLLELAEEALLQKIVNKEIK